MYTYKILTVQKASGLSSLEGLINERAAEGFDPFQFWEIDSRLVVLLRKKVEPMAGKRGRPSKATEEEAQLGS